MAKAGPNVPGEHRAQSIEAPLRQQNRGCCRTAGGSGARGVRGVWMWMGWPGRQDPRSLHHEALGRELPQG